MEKKYKIIKSFAQITDLVDFLVKFTERRTYTYVHLCKFRKVFPWI